MNNEKIFKEAVDVAIRLAKAKWGDKPAKGCMWIGNNGCIYSRKEFVPEGLEVFPTEERWHRKLIKYIEKFI